MVKTYEGFFDWFKKKPIEKVSGKLERLPKEIPIGSDVSKRVKHFFETTIFSDFNYIIQEITDEYGSGKISYIFETEFTTLMINEEDDKFKISDADLKFMGMTQDYILDRVGSFAKIKVNIRDFQWDDESNTQTHLYYLNKGIPCQSEFIEDVAERLMDMCPDIQSYKIGSWYHREPYRTLTSDNVIQFNF